MKLMRSDRLDAIIGAAIYSAIITAGVSYVVNEISFEKYQEEKGRSYTDLLSGYNRASRSWGVCKQELAHLKEDVSHGWHLEGGVPVARKSAH